MLEDLDIFRSNGRAAKPVSAALGRELTPADLAMLNVERGTTAPPLKRLAARVEIKESVLLREALEDLLLKYKSAPPRPV